MTNQIDGSRKDNQDNTRHTGKLLHRRNRDRKNPVPKTPSRPDQSHTDCKPLLGSCPQDGFSEK